MNGSGLTGTAKQLGALSVLLSLVLAGCSSMKVYRDSYSPNLSISTTTSSGSAFVKIRPYLHLYRVRGSCDAEYLGTVELKDKLTQVGIQPGQPTHLKFVLKTTETFGNGAGFVDFGATITPQAGRRYAAEVNYVDKMYDVKVRELDKNGKTLREYPRLGKQCTAGKS